MRVAEIVQDFRNIQAWIAAIRANPSAEEYNEEGYVVLRRCAAEAQALLLHPFHLQNGMGANPGDDEESKAHLRR